MSALGGIRGVEERIGLPEPWIEWRGGELNSHWTPLTAQWGERLKEKEPPAMTGGGIKGDLVSGSCGGVKLRTWQALRHGDFFCRDGLQARQRLAVTPATARILIG